MRRQVGVPTHAFAVRPTLTMRRVEAGELLLEGPQEGGEVLKSADAEAAVLVTDMDVHAA